MISTEYLKVNLIAGLRKFNPILHTWIRDSCFTCDGSKTIQDFPLLFNIGYGILSMHKSSLSNSEGPVSIQGWGGQGGAALCCGLYCSTWPGPPCSTWPGRPCSTRPGPAWSTWPSHPFSAQHTYTMLTHT
jgi:hypothetical protein